MDQKKIILVTGATSRQGNSVAKALLADNHFTVRILTANTNFPKAIALKNAGAEVVEGSLDDIESLQLAMKDCYGVFGITAFHENAEKEFTQGKNLVDAVKENNIKHFVFSSLDSYSKLSGGTLPVEYAESKAALAEYIKGLHLPATFVQNSFAYENFFTFSKLQADEYGGFYFGFPQGDARMAAVSTTDYGAVVTTVFNHPADYTGRTVKAVGDDRSCAEYAYIMSRVLGKRIYFRHISKEVYASNNFTGAAALANMFEAQRLYVSDHMIDLIETYGLNPSTQNFENWVKTNREKFTACFESAGKRLVA
ncbi:MAG: NmrA/HSCARG family protein [Ferruginibacter sp.]